MAPCSPRRVGGAVALSQVPNRGANAFERGRQGCATGFTKLILPLAESIKGCYGRHR
jgi:hypothetical protein